MPTPFRLARLKALLPSLILLATLLPVGVSLAQPSLRVMSYNIRFNNPGDGNNAWPHRKDRVISMIAFHGADVIGLQEVLREQVDDLATALPRYAWIGVGRDDGQDGGEFSPIFYRKDRLVLEDQGTFWLSESPDDVGSRGWDAALPRVVTWGRFRDREEGAVFFHFNTHFDHRGETARTEGAALLRERVAAITRQAPVLVTGDFNFTPDAAAYRILTSSKRSDRAFTDGLLATITPHHGPQATWSTFDVSSGLGGRIDYIFVKNEVAVLRHGILTDQWDGRYPSDHLPVLAEVLIR